MGQILRDLLVGAIWDFGENMVPWWMSIDPSPLAIHPSRWYYFRGRHTGCMLVQLFFFVNALWFISDGIDNNRVWDRRASRDGIRLGFCSAWSSKNIMSSLSCCRRTNGYSSYQLVLSYKTDKFPKRSFVGEPSVEPSASRTSTITEWLLVLVFNWPA
jgi:hypothetical protein